MKRMLASLAVAIGGLGAVLAGREFAPAAVTASVTVVHGIPHATVAVFVNGKNILPDFKPARSRVRCSFRLGSHQVKIEPSTGCPCARALAPLATSAPPLWSRRWAGVRNCWRVASRLTTGTSQGVLFVLEAHNVTESADTAAIISGGPGAQYRRFTRARRGDWHAAVATFRPGSEPTLLNAGLRRRGVAGDS